MLYVEGPTSPSPRFLQDPSCLSVDLTNYPPHMIATSVSPVYLDKTNSMILLQTQRPSVANKMCWENILSFCSGLLFCLQFCTNSRFGWFSKWLRVKHIWSIGFNSSKYVFFLNETLAANSLAESCKLHPTVNTNYIKNKKKIKKKFDLIIKLKQDKTALNILHLTSVPFKYNLTSTYQWKTLMYFRCKQENWNTEWIRPNDRMLN